MQYYVEIADLLGAVEGTLLDAARCLAALLRGMSGSVQLLRGASDQ